MFCLIRLRISKFIFNSIFYNLYCNSSVGNYIQVLDFYLTIRIIFYNLCVKSMNVIDDVINIPKYKENQNSILVPCLVCNFRGFCLSKYNKKPLILSICIFVSLAKIDQRSILFLRKTINIRRACLDTFVS